MTHNRFIYLALILIKLYYNVILCLFAYFSVLSLKEKLVIEFFKPVSKLPYGYTAFIWKHSHSDLDSHELRSESSQIKGGH